MLVFRYTSSNINCDNVLIFHCWASGQGYRKIYMHAYLKPNCSCSHKFNLSKTKIPRNIFYYCSGQFWLAENDKTIKYSLKYKNIVKVSRKWLIQVTTRWCSLQLTVYIRLHMSAYSKLQLTILLYIFFNSLIWLTASQRSSRSVPINQS